LFVGVLLPFRHFQGLENFFHVIEGPAENLNDLIDLVDGLLNRTVECLRRLG
jgi:hypothetical protein